MKPSNRYFLPLVLLCSLTAITHLSGCSGKDPETEALKSFEELVQKLERKSKNEKPTYYAFQYNVKNTESLVSPFTAVLRCKQNTGDRVATFEIRFAMQEGTWVHKSIESKVSSGSDDMDSSNRSADEVVSTALAGFSKSVIDRWLSEITGAPRIARLFKKAPVEDQRE